MTATSGPGFSLMVETLQYALMTETPVVIVVSQRLGPATGGATQNAQGDVLFVEYATSGGYPIPVLCPVDAVDAYLLTAESLPDRRGAADAGHPPDRQGDEQDGRERGRGRASGADRGPPPPRSGPRGALRPVRAIERAWRTCRASPRSAGAWKVTTTGSAHNDRASSGRTTPRPCGSLRAPRAKVPRRTRGAGAGALAPGTRGPGRSSCPTGSPPGPAARWRGTSGGRVPGGALEVLSLFPVPAAAIAKAAEAVDAGGGGGGERPRALRAARCAPPRPGSRHPAGERRRRP